MFDETVGLSLYDSSSSSSSALAIPKGTAVALPSIQISEETIKRNHYGGKGDKPHLGGFADNNVDMDGVTPELWKYMVQQIGIKSILDVGCGRGVSTSWFHLHGVDSYCVEGSHDAVLQTLLPPKIVTEHDFSRGPWWPSQTVDAIWCVELLEHIGRNYHVNLLPSFRKAGIIFATHSTWGGWHHVEVHDTDWWIQKFESYGFSYSEKMTETVRSIAAQAKDKEPLNGKRFKGQHVWLHMMVFINTQVTALPAHHHLFSYDGGHGCYSNTDKTGETWRVMNRPCGKKEESKIPDYFLPIQLNSSMDKEWENLVFGKSSL